MQNKIESDRMVRSSGQQLFSNHRKRVKNMTSLVTQKLLSNINSLGYADASMVKLIPK